jgi:protein O-GlcNAc transferase
MKGDTKGALAAFDDALEFEPKHAAAAFNRGVVLLKTGDLKRASEQFAGVVADTASPYRALAAYHRAIALDRLRLPQEAATWLDRALALDASLDAARLYKGLLLEQRGEHQAAAREYLDYLKKHPDSTVAHLRFGITAKRAGRNDVARQYLDRVVSLAPASPEAVEARKYLVMWE